MGSFVDYKTLFCTAILLLPACAPELGDWEEEACVPFSECGPGYHCENDVCVKDASDESNTSGADGGVSNGEGGGNNTPPSENCGNNTIEDDEVCDDGNQVTETECAYGTSTCTACNANCSAELSLVGRYCGDGVKDPEEECDEGSENGGIGCSNTCELASGLVFSGVSGEYVFIDDTSGVRLMWQGCPAGQTGYECEDNSVNEISYLEATTFCSTSDWGGYTDWEIPNVTQLRSLVRGCQPLELTGSTCPILHSCGASDEQEEHTCGVDSCSENCPGEPPDGECHWPEDLWGSCDTYEPYWSSTFYSKGASEYYFVMGFHHPVTIKQDIMGENQVRCVRTAQ